MDTTERSGRRRTEGLLERIKVEYCEMPGLCLTPERAARLWYLDTGLVSAALRELAETGFLQRRIAGAYTLTDGSRRACVWFMDA